MCKALRFGKRIMCLLLCFVTVLLMAAPASAAMAELDPVMEDRQVSKIRYSASYNGYVVGNLEDGTPLQVTGETRLFYRIDCQGMRCYIAKEQVKVDDNGCYYVNCKADSKETTKLPCRSDKEAAVLQKQVVDLCQNMLGVPYAWGGTTPRGFDCSGFVQYIYRQMGYSLSRTCSPQLSHGMVVAVEDLQPGDLLFFYGTLSSYDVSSHVGIYVGNGMMIHAGSKGICYASLLTDYFDNHFLCARRVILSSVSTYQSIPGQFSKASRSSGHQTGAFFLSVCS